MSNELLERAMFALIEYEQYTRSLGIPFVRQRGGEIVVEIEKQINNVERSQKVPVPSSNGYDRFQATVERHRGNSRRVRKA